MNAERIPILDRQQIDKKLQRMAYEIWERNSDEESILLIGIEQGGRSVANELAARLEKISGLKVTVSGLRINKRAPLNEVPADLDVSGRAVIIVDDVANSGRTLLYALRPLLAGLPKKISISVLVDRQHKAFPVAADIVGHTIATTLQENIVVEIDEQGISGAWLQ